MNKILEDFDKFLSKNIEKLPRFIFFVGPGGEAPVDGEYFDFYVIFHFIFSTMGVSRIGGLWQSERSVPSRFPLARFVRNVWSPCFAGRVLCTGGKVAPLLLRYPSHSGLSLSYI